MTRRYEPSGRWLGWSGRPAAAVSRRRLVRVAGLLLDRTRKVIFWPLPVRAWWATLRRELPPADLYHAFGILTIPVALDLGRRARSAGRAGRVVYDVIDVILESNNYDRVPAPVLAMVQGARAALGRAAPNAIVTVNDADRRSPGPSSGASPTDRPSCSTASPAGIRRRSGPDRIREATGIPPERKVVLFLGRLGRERGLEEAAEAVLHLEDAALVVLGFGPWAERLRERDREPRYAGHHYTLPPVHPDDVPLWTASADVSVIAVPANSLNQRLSTPNKFWESLTAGTPVVVGRDLEVMR